MHFMGHLSNASNQFRHEIGNVFFSSTHIMRHGEISSLDDLLAFTRNQKSRSTSELIEGRARGLPKRVCSDLPVRFRIIAAGTTGPGFSYPRIRRSGLVQGNNWTDTLAVLRHFKVTKLSVLSHDRMGSPQLC